MNDQAISFKTVMSLSKKFDHVPEDIQFENEMLTAIANDTDMSRRPYIDEWVEVVGYKNTQPRPGDYEELCLIQEHLEECMTISEIDVAKLRYYLAHGTLS